jgi:GrpB-like predicted nucleotidyltransferase (UPF0157 family)
MVTIVEPDPRWSEEFERIAAEIRDAVGPLAERIDHIGSTSVPGLAAKDVVDVQITVNGHEGIAATMDALGDAGWDRRTDISTDHPVAGFPDEPLLWEKGYLDQRPGDRAIHVHVRVAGRPNQRYALLFRDYLRAHPLAAAAYAELKRRLAALAPDSATYADAKDPACDLIYVAAEAWAAETGWGPVIA